MALQTRRWHYRGFPARGTKLTFLRSGGWAGVELTWSDDGTFAHWYVNFQLPLTRTDAGYDTLDLVIDIVVAPDWSWTWKDEEPFRVAIRDGLFGADVEAAVVEEAERVQRMIASRTGPFDQRWLSWTAPRGWAAPVLPEDFADGAGTPPDAPVTLSSDPAI